MSASNIIKDPGSGGTIKVDISGGICHVDSDDGVARTLQSPLTVPDGVEVTLVTAGTGGTLDVAYDGKVGASNTTSIEMDNATDWIRLVVLEVNGVKDWYTLASNGTVTS
tara:strand:- start:469 stop:798 length:330 start_codon:yes stop_codon:yes gene_type:complete